MSEIGKAIDLLEDRLKALLTKYEFLKKENKILFQNVNQLEYQVDKNRQLLANQNKKYELLKIAKL